MKRTPEEILERMDALLDEYDGAKDKYDRGVWKDKFGERLGAYSDKLKRINGDDFDVVNSSYDEHKSDYSYMSDDDYVNALEENIKSVIAKIWPEKSEEEVAKVAEEVAENAEPTETTVEVTEETTSDEETKEKPVEEEVKEAAEATPSKVDDIVAEVATAKPKDVDPAEDEDDTDFEKLKNDPVYKRMH